MSPHPEFPYAPEAIDLIMRAGEYVHAENSQPDDDRPAADQSGEAP